MIKVLGENAEISLHQDEDTDLLDAYAKEKLGNNFLVVKAFNKVDKCYTTFLLYEGSEPIRADETREGMYYHIDTITAIIKSQNW